MPGPNIGLSGGDPASNFTACTVNTSLLACPDPDIRTRFVHHQVTPSGYKKYHLCRMAALYLRQPFFAYGIQNNTMSNYLVISALGNDKPGIVDQLTETVSACDCNLEDSRMSALGGTFAIIMLISGNWDKISKLESTLPAMEEKLGMTIMARRTEPQKNPARRDLLPYAADVVSIDHPGIVHKLANFFSSRNINIEELVTSSYAAAHTGTPMFSVHMEVGIPSDMQISVLRETFMDYCDLLNLDAVIEPIK